MNFNVETAVTWLRQFFGAVMQEFELKQRILKDNRAGAVNK
jgi:hypothetical protein